MNHVSDEEIQAYLQGVELANREQFSEHIRKCEFCREQVAAYLMVYESLENDEGMLLPAEFSEKVVQKVSVRFRSAERIRESLLIGLTTVIALVTFLWMVDIKHFFQLCKNLVHTVIISLSYGLPFLNRINLTLLISGLLIFLFIILLDNILHNIKHH